MENINTIKEKVREAIIEAVPDIQRDTGAPVGSGYIETRAITLEDVLRTLHKHNPANKTRVTVECDGQFLNNLEKTLGPRWVLGLNLDHQPHETIEYLHKMLALTPNTQGGSNTKQV